MFSEELAYLWFHFDILQWARFEGIRIVCSVLSVIPLNLAVKFLFLVGLSHMECPLVLVYLHMIQSEVLIAVKLCGNTISQNLILYKPLI
jgi:hypothetical protein